MCLFNTCQSCLACQPPAVPRLKKLLIKPLLVSRISEAQCGNSEFPRQQENSTQEQSQPPEGSVFQKQNETSQSSQQKQTNESSPAELVASFTSPLADHYDKFYARVQTLHFKKFALFGGLLSESTSLCNKVNDLSSYVSSLIESKLSQKQTSTRVHQGDSTSETILKKYFKSKKYRFELKLAEPLETPLYKDRNCVIKVELQDQNGRLCENINRLSINVFAVTKDADPKLIEFNLNNESLVRLGVQPTLHLGKCEIKKLQVKEVSSHFSQGAIHLVIFGKEGIFPKGSVCPSDIRPLILQDIVVKAKKMPSKDLPQQ